MRGLIYKWDTSFIKFMRGLIYKWDPSFINENINFMSVLAQMAPHNSVRVNFPDHLGPIPDRASALYCC